MSIPAGYTQLSTGFWQKTSDLSGPYAWTGAAFYLISTGVAGSGVAADYTQHPSGFWFKTADGSGPYSYDGTSFYLAGNGGPSGAITVATVNVTSAINMSNGSTFNLYNTADQTTNYERLRADFVSNVAQIGTQYAGSASSRNLRVGTFASGGSAIDAYLQFSQTQPFFNFVRSNAGANISFISLTGITTSASSGVNPIFNVNPTINQSGTAGATILNVDPTVSATGSGTYLVQRWGWNGTAIGHITNAGNFQVAQGVSSVTGYFFGASLGSTDTVLLRDASGIVAQRAGTNAQTFRVYNTYTDASNNEYITRQWSSNICYDRTVANGTGTRRLYIPVTWGTTVAGLPSLTANDVGARSVVTDSIGNTFCAIVAGGGANVVPVFWDGTQWRNG